MIPRDIDIGDIVRKNGNPHDLTVYITSTAARLLNISVHTLRMNENEDL